MKNLRPTALPANPALTFPQKHSGLLTGNLPYSGTNAFPLLLNPGGDDLKFRFPQEIATSYIVNYGYIRRKNALANHSQFHLLVL